MGGTPDKVDKVLGTTDLKCTDSLYYYLLHLNVNVILAYKIKIIIFVCFVFLKMQLDHIIFFFLSLSIY